MPGYLPSTLLIRRHAFLRVGPFGNELRVGEWAEWYVRATEAALETRMLPEIVAQRRIHENNKGVVQREDRVEYLRIVREALRRRRARMGGGS